MFSILSRFFICTSLTACFISHSTCFGIEQIVDQATVPILSPGLKQRKTLKLQLDNELQVLLISDPGAEQSSAVLVVETGSWEEPKNHPGLAHFLEHMLFLGTSAYPIEDDYQRYISQHGGLANAFTANDETAYLFSVNHDALEGALDRFAHFFKTPLFSASGVSRELHAIDEEYAKNIENDSFRLQYVLKELARPDHPDSRFQIGNSVSLAHTSPAILKEWFQQHYSANIMKLVVYSALPLDKLKPMVISAFEGIPNNHRAPLSVVESITPEHISKQVVFIEPVKNVRELTILWELPAQFAQMNLSHPEKIICHLLGHESHSSLLAQLKREHLATHVNCGVLPSSRTHHFLYLEVELTEDGLKKYTTVVERIYQTLALLRQTGIPRSLFEEVQKTTLLNYQFQERQNAFQEAMEHAFNIPHEDLATYPERTQLIQQYDPQGVASLLRYLMPENGCVIITAPYQETRVKATHREKWLGVGYALKPIARLQYNKWLEAHPLPTIELPAPNPYLVTEFNTSKAEDLPATNYTLPNNREVPTPALLLDNEKGRVYYSQDTFYQVPKTSFIFSIRTPEIAPTNPKKIVLSELYIKCLKEELDEISYYAHLAGTNLSIERSKNENGIQFHIQGYSHQAPRLVEDVVHALRSVRCDEKTFKKFKDDLLRKYANKTVDSPLNQGIETLENVLYKDFVTSREKEAALKRLSFEEFQEFNKKLFSYNYIEGMIYGHISPEAAKRTTQILEEALGGQPYSIKNHYQKELLLLPREQGPYYLEDKVQSQGNATLLAIESGPASYKNRAAQQILIQAIKEAFFHTLRTKQQTCYIVHSRGEEVENQLLNYFAVQSNSHDSRDLLSRFELFFENYLRDLESEEIPPKRYEILLATFKEQLKQPPKDLQEMTELLYQLAFTYNGAFDRPQKRLKALDELSYADFVQFAHTTLSHNNKRRLAILVQGTFASKPPFHYEKGRNPEFLKKEGTFAPNENSQD